MGNPASLRVDDVAITDARTLLSVRSCRGAQYVMPMPVEVVAALDQYRLRGAAGGRAIAV